MTTELQPLGDDCPNGTCPWFSVQIITSRIGLDGTVA